MKNEILQAVKSVDLYPKEIVDGYKSVDEQIKTNFGYVDIEVKWYIDIFSSNNLNPLDDDYGVEFIGLSEFYVYNNEGEEINTDITEEELIKAIL